MIERRNLVQGSTLFDQGDTYLLSLSRVGPGVRKSAVDGRVRSYQVLFVGVYAACLFEVRLKWVVFQDWLGGGRRVSLLGRHGVYGLDIELLGKSV